MRIVIKGGVWRNTEDEILKAAISKYGKNQWARISSLLVRKTPKQCKARWMEWLDPAIKKTEWSKEEDEKLLHLAKLMPTQWRTIAPIVGRTANQCLERYQKLLDEAEQQEANELGLAGVDDAGPSADDVRRLRPGEVDPDPENRPARPDPIDMDEDEKEMLSEARARLANTQGKKAKRKARERQLEEARRLAMLQKKRELKAAGILMRAKPKKNGMDYMADIPFEKAPAPGFYDTTLEDARKFAAPVNKSLRQLEGKRKQDIEEEAAHKKAKKARDAKTNSAAEKAFVPSKDSLAREQKEAMTISKRRRLVLPEAQVGERELEEIVKLGTKGESARELVGGDAGGAGEGLLGEYEALGKAKDARTPRTAPQHDNVMAEARNIRNLSMQQTPLFGGENTPLHELVGRGTGFEGATPSTSVAATPNPLATPFRNDDGSATPMSVSSRGGPGATPLRTPMRDSLSINDNDSSFGETPRGLRDLKNSLKQGFMNLPQPKNEFELVLPEDEEEDGEVEKAMRIEDASEREERLKAIRAEEEKKRLERRSQVVKRGLPRPAAFDAEAYLKSIEELSLEEGGGSEKSELEKEIAREMVLLISHDSILYPVPGSSTPGGGSSTLPFIPDASLAAARSLVHSELAELVGLPGANESLLKRVLALPSTEFDNVWSPEWKNLAFDPKTEEWVSKDSLGDGEKIEGFRMLIDRNREEMVRESGKAAKVEKKLGVTLGGYQARAKALGTKLGEATDEVARSKIELRSFARLEGEEIGALARRTEALKDEVEKLERREKEGNHRFGELSAIKRVIEEELEEMVMAEAEALNNAALDAMEG